jgi:hypothetical protein
MVGSIVGVIVGCAVGADVGKADGPTVTATTVGPAEEPDDDRQPHTAAAASMIHEKATNLPQSVRIDSISH